MRSRPIVAIVDLLRILWRAVKYLFRLGPRSFLREAWTRAWGFIRYGLPVTSPGSMFELNVQYARWLLRRPSTDRWARTTVREVPVVSVLVPVYETDPDLLRRTVDSVRGQVYSRWELCLADDASRGAHIRPMLEGWAAEDDRIRVAFCERNAGISAASNRALELATGDLVALLDHDDELESDALLEVVRLYEDAPLVDVVYTDEDKLARRRRVDPFFKPSWSPDLLRSMNYITHLSVFRRELVQQVGGFRSEVDGSQDYDLLLRTTERARGVRHIPKPLYHWRIIMGSAARSADAKPYAYEAAQRALADAASRTGFPADVEVQAPGRYRLRYHLTDHPPVTIITTQPERHLQSLTGYPGPLDVRTVARMDAREVRRVQGAFVIVLDGAEPLRPDWLEALLEHAQRPGVGAVGGALSDARGRIAESGLLLSAERLVEPAFAGWHTEVPLYFGISQAVRNCAALSGRCLAIRTALLEESGGLDDDLSFFAAAVDLTLRLRYAGHLLITTPHAEVLATRPPDAVPAADADRLRHRWSHVLDEGDPYANPNLVFTREGPRLRPTPGFEPSGTASA